MTLPTDEVRATHLEDCYADSDGVRVHYMTGGEGR